MRTHPTERECGRKSEGGRGRKRKGRTEREGARERVGVGGGVGWGGGNFGARKGLHRVVLPACETY